LLNNGADINQRNYYGLTALHRASEEGRTSTVKP
jgi:ankyrin repeat protein